MQAGMEEAVAAMNLGAERVEHGTQLAQQAGAALDRILAAVTALSEQIQTIAQDSESIQDAINQVAVSMDNVARVTYENTAATEEMAAQSEQVKIGRASCRERE